MHSEGSVPIWGQWADAFRNGLQTLKELFSIHTLPRCGRAKYSGAHLALDTEEIILWTVSRMVDCLGSL